MLKRVDLIYPLINTSSSADMMTEKAQRDTFSPSVFIAVKAFFKFTLLIKPSVPLSVVSDQRMSTYGAAVGTSLFPKSMRISASFR